MTHLIWLLPAVVVLAALGKRRSHNRRPLSAAPLIRWHLGRRLDGQFMTDATWSSPASAVLHPTGHAHWWYWLSYRRRAGIRLATEIAILATVYGLARALTLTLALLAAAAAAAALAGLWHAAYRIRYWRHDRHYVRPLELSLQVRRLPPVSIAVTRDGEVVTSVEIEWAPGTEIDPADKDQVLQAVTDRLAIEAPDEKWRLKGRQRSVTFTQSDPPPDYVPWDVIAAAVERAPVGELVFGTGRRDALIAASYGDSPHVAVPGGSGGGKSNLAAVLLLQEMMRGSLIFNLDPKWISHLWLQNLPNVINAHDTPDLHLALTWLGKELLRRTKAAWYSAGGTGRIRGSVGPRIIVLAEELNYGMPGLKNYWRETRPKDGPKLSPAIEGLSAVSCAGRASDIHEWLLAQLLTVASTGVSDSTIRTNAGIKAMARWDEPGWKMAVGKHIPMPPPTTIPGRIQLVTGDGVRETQVPYLHLDDPDPDVAEKAVAWARELAVSGTVAQIPSGPQGVPPQLWPASVLRQPRLALPPGHGHVTAATPGIVPALKTMTYTEAMTAGVFGSRGKDAVRKAIQRAGLQPAITGRSGGAHVYYLTDLHAVAKGMRPE